MLEWRKKKSYSKLLKGSPWFVFLYFHKLKIYIKLTHQLPKIPQYKTIAIKKKTKPTTKPNHPNKKNPNSPQTNKQNLVLKDFCK